MDDQQKDQEVFRQNLNEKGSFQTLFQIYLLFTQKGTRPDGKEVQKVLLSKFEKVDIVANVKDSLSTFAIWKYIVEYKDNQRLPAQVLMSDFENFDGNNVDLMQRSQLWDCPEKDEILSNCKYKIMISEFTLLKLATRVVKSVSYSFGSIILVIVLCILENRLVKTVPIRSTYKTLCFVFLKR